MSSLPATTRGHGSEQKIQPCHISPPSCSCFTSPMKTTIKFLRLQTMTGHRRPTYPLPSPHAAETAKAQHGKRKTLDVPERSNQKTQIFRGKRFISRPSLGTTVKRPPTTTNDKNPQEKKKGANTANEITHHAVRPPARSPARPCTQ